MRLGAFADGRRRAWSRGRWPRCPPSSRVTLREGTTPALTRALRAGTLDLAVLAQHTAVPAARRRVAAARSSRRCPSASSSSACRRATRSPPPAPSRSSELAGQIWVASRSDAGDSLLGVWPGLAERADVRYVVRDWLAKLQIVAAGLAITTLAPVALDVAARTACAPSPCAASRRSCDGSCSRAAPARSTARPRASPTR